MWTQGVKSCKFLPHQIPYPKTWHLSCDIPNDASARVSKRMDPQKVTVKMTGYFNQYPSFGPKKLDFYIQKL